MAYVPPPLPHFLHRMPASEEPSLDPPPLHHHIRWMTRADMADVLEIDRLSFADPWCEVDFANCLRQRGIIGLVAEQSAVSIAAYMLYGLRRDSMLIHRLAVHPQYRLRGFARAMVEKLIGKLTRQRRSHLLTTVCESDLHAHLFFRQMGFLATEVTQGQFGPRDGYAFEYSVDPADRVLASVLCGSGRVVGGGDGGVEV